MLRVVLGVIAVLAAPSAAAATREHYYRGSLLNGSTRVALVPAVAYFGQAGDASSSAVVPVEQMSRAELRTEYDRLDATRPSLGLPITLLAVGGGMALFGLGFISVADTLPLLVIGLSLLGGAALMITFGFITLFSRIATRREVTTRMDDIKARLDTLDRDQGDPPPNFEGAPPPPPPPPPPGAWLFPVEPDILVATF